MSDTPETTRQSASGTAIDTIIRDAYATVARPDRLIGLLDEAERRIEQGDTSIGRVDSYLMQASDLIEEVSPLIGSDFAEFDTGSIAAQRTDLVLRRDLTVLGFDAETFRGEGMAVGNPVPDWVWDPVEIEDDKRRIARGQDATGLAGFLRLFAHPEDEQGRWYTIRREEVSGQEYIRLRAVQFRWKEAAGAAFAEALRLTDTELALTRHLVDGGSVRSFAERRGRSVGTARNQLKALCRKLAIGSQQELLMLYTGFAHSLDLMEEEAGDGRHVCANIHREPDGNRIAWEEHGDPQGKPVLYFHPFFEGALFTAEQDRAARDAGLRIIAPWRPLSGETTGSGKRLDLVRDFSRRLGPFLDALKVGRCAVLGATAGAPFALSFTQTHTERACGVVLCGPVIPHAKGGNFADAPAGYRRVLQMTRLAPGFARIYIRATLAGSLKGQFDTYIDDFMRGNPGDRAHYADPVIRETIRRSGTYTFIKTLDGPTEGVIIESAEWSQLCEGIACEVVVTCGQNGDAALLPARKRFADRFGFSLDDGFHRSGQLTMHDDPRRIFAHLRRMIDGCG